MHASVDMRFDMHATNRATTLGLFWPSITAHRRSNAWLQPAGTMHLEAPCGACRGLARRVGVGVARGVGAGQAAELGGGVVGLDRDLGHDVHGGARVFRILAWQDVDRRQHAAFVDAHVLLAAVRVSATPLRREQA
eukprot:3586263-Rhodomonas_salina.2